MSALFPKDKALVGRLLNGDATTFTEFFESYAPRLYRFALIRVDRDADAAEEIVQATLIKVLGKLSTYRAEAPLFSWLCTFCRREISAWYRKRKRTRQRETVLTDHEEVQAALGTLSDGTFESPQRRLLRRELATLVQATLDHLPGGYGKLLELKYVEGLKVQEIADRLGLSFPAAQSKLGRARAAFREGFGPLAPALEAIAQTRSAS